MGDGQIAAEGAFLERELHLTWKYGSMFRPPLLWPTPSSSENHSQVTCLGLKHYFEDYPSTTLSFQNYVLQFCPVDPDNPWATFPVASHKGFLCIHGHLDVGHGFKRPSLIVCNPFRKIVVKILPVDGNFEVGLMHMRVDDSGHFKLLVAGSSCTSNGTQHQLSHYTEEYDSKTGSWEQEENSDLPGPSKRLFQNGAYYKDSFDQERLFCISTIDALDNQGVLMYDLKRKSWSTCQVPQVTAEGSDVQPVDPISIEEYGRIIFLFSAQKCGEHVYNFIHKLNLDAVGNVTWEQITRKKRSADGNGFLVYPSTMCVPSSDELTKAGGCVFAFSMDKCGETLCIHKFDPKGDTLWGHPMSFQTPKQLVLRGPNWTDEEKHGSLLLNLEALNASVEGPPWTYISQGLWMWGAFDRCPKSCQGQWDTLYKIYKKILKQLKSNGSVNFDLGLNQRCYNLMEAILAVKVKNRVSLTAKARVLPRRSRKRIRSAEILDSANSVQFASGAGGPSSSATLIWASTTLQPSGTGGPSSSTGTPFIATVTTQPSAVAEPSSQTVPLLGSTNANEPFYTIARPAAPIILSDNLDKAVEHGRTLNKSVQRVSDYQRAVNILQENGQELTATQQGELFKKSLDLDLRKEQHKNRNSNAGKLKFSKFIEVIDFLQLHGSHSGFSVNDVFEMLMKSLETDILRLKQL